MYLIVDEENNIWTVAEVTDSMYNACDEGLVSIVNTTHNKEYYLGGWNVIPEYTGE
jgi:hypothetical protein